MSLKLCTLAAIVTAAAAGMASSLPASADDMSRQTKSEVKAEYKDAVRRAEADYKAAKAKCKELSGNDKDVCMKEAEATETKAKAAAKAERKGEAAKADAREDMRDADYKTAKEKCDAMSGNAKDDCLAQAKKTYHK